MRVLARLNLLVGKPNLLAGLLNVMVSVWNAGSVVDNNE